MLGKLMKYEFRAAGRLMWPLYLAVLATALMLGISIRVTDHSIETVDGISIESNENMSILAMIFVFVFFGVCIATLVMTVILVIESFHKNLLGNPGYLMFTLPVKTSTQVWNKVISGTIWVILGALTAILSGLVIILVLNGPVEFFKGIGSILMNANVKDYGVLFEWIIVAIIGMAEGIMKIYAAIALGHQFENRRVLGAIVSYVGFGIAESTIGNLIGIHMLDTFVGMDASAIGFSAGILCVVLFAIYYVITWLLLDKRLNLQ